MTDEITESGPRVEHVAVDLPLAVRHAATARAVAASIAADVGFSVDDIDDLRLAVNEAVSVLSDVDAPEGARLLIRFEHLDGGVRVLARREGVEESVSELDDLALRILRAVSDEFEVDDGQFVIVKRSARA